MRTEEIENSADSSAATADDHPRAPAADALTIAIAKGRLQTDVLGLLAAAGVTASEAALRSRRLSVEDESGLYRFVFVKPADVPVYVEHGIADCGVVGRDVLLETEADLLQPLDLKLGRCRLVVAAQHAQAASPERGVLRVATKYPRVALAHFGERGIPVEIITLSGSVELAPVLGLSDCIVDLVETGETLRENGLIVTDEITESSARLVVNRASYQLKTEAVSRLIDQLSSSVESGKAD